MTARTTVDRGPCDNPICERPAGETWAQEWRIAVPDRGETWRFCCAYCLVTFARLLDLQRQRALCADDRLARP